MGRKGTGPPKGQDRVCASCCRQEWLVDALWFADLLVDSGSCGHSWGRRGALVDVGWGVQQGGAEVQLLCIRSPVDWTWGIKESDLYARPFSVCTSCASPQNGPRLVRGLGGLLRWEDLEAWTQAVSWVRHSQEAAPSLGCTRLIRVDL